VSDNPHHGKTLAMFSSIIRLNPMEALVLRGKSLKSHKYNSKAVSMLTYRPTGNSCHLYRLKSGILNHCRDCKCPLLPSSKISVLPGGRCLKTLVTQCPSSTTDSLQMTSGRKYSKLMAQLLLWKGTSHRLYYSLGNKSTRDQLSLSAFCLKRRI
jgi:hypothetical protein